MSYVDAATRLPQIVAAARAVMKRDGIARTTIRAVAAEAEIPLGTLQHVFPAKGLLVQAVINDVANEEAQLAASLTVQGGIAETIRQSARAYWAVAIVDNIPEQMTRLELLNHALRNAGEGESAGWPYNEQAAVLGSLLEAAAEHGEETSDVPFERIARIFLAGLDGLMLQYACDRDRIRADEDLEALIDATIAYARIRPATSAGE